MTNIPSPPAKPVLITGASGKLGRDLVAILQPAGWRLRLTDIAPFPDELGAKSEFVAADLNDSQAISRLAEGCAAIVHFGGLVEYGTFESVLGPNCRGTYHVFEAAKQQGIRVVLASSNHVIGFHERTTALDSDCTYRPDSFYGLSKVFGEMVARFYWDKHGVESVSLRIGSCFPEPIQERMLATWLSRPDMARLVACSVVAKKTEFAVVWGASNNSASWWRKDDRGRIGWAPQDSADGYGDRFPPPGPGVADRFQGGKFCEVDYSRKD